MIQTDRRFRWPAFRVMAFVVVTSISGMAPELCDAQTLDVLDEPAQQSPRSLAAMQTAVARAGKRLVSVGERGIVLLSDDGGKAWRQAKVPVSVTLTNVRFVDDRLGWVVGHGGVLLKTLDGGESWTKVLTGVEAARLEMDAARASGKAERIADAERLVADGPDKPFLDVYFQDPSRGMVIGAYGMALRTQDGGATWTSMAGSFDNPKGLHYYAIQAVGPAILVVGEQGTVYRSIDDGGTFSSLPSPSRGTLFGIVGSADGNPTVFGLRGNVFHSDTGGDSWNRLDVPDISVTGGILLGDGALLLVDEVGHLMISRDGGRNFAVAGPQLPTLVSGVVQGPDGQLVLAGARGNLVLPVNKDISLRSDK